MQGATLTARVNAASENAYLKILSRGVIPPVLAIIGWLAVATVNNIKEDIGSIKTSVARVMDLGQTTRTDLEVTKEDLKQYKQHEDELRRIAEDNAHQLDLKVEAVRNLIIGQGERSRR